MYDETNEVIDFVSNTASNRSKRFDEYMAIRLAFLRD